MSSDPAQEPGPGISTASLGAGALLRQAREAAGLHIGALSVSLKVPVAKLEALESDRLDLLPDAVFARALASSVCRTLKVDPAPILERLPEHVRPQLQLESSTTDRTSLNASRPLGRAPFVSRLTRPVAVVAGLLVLGALVLLFQPALTGMFATMEPVVNDAPAVPAASPTLPERPLAVASQAPAGDAAVPAAAASAAQAAPALVATAPASSAAPATVPARVSAPVVPAAQPAAPTAGATVLFKARGTSWIEVTDSGGTVQLRRILSAGESVPVAGALPLAIVVGRADAIEVQVRGQPFDLAPLSRDNVARFQVK